MFCGGALSLLFLSCRGSGHFKIPPQAQLKTASPTFSKTMPSFQTRLFPPKDLDSVPLDYITDQLHNLATNFWDKPDTADCTISMLCLFLSFSLHLLTLYPVVPFPHALGKPDLPAFSSTSTLQPTFSYTTSYDSTSLGRRVTQPPLNAVPRISLPVSLFFLFVLSSSSNI